MQIQISWLLQKPTDLDLHCLQRQGISGFSGTRVNNSDNSTTLYVYSNYGIVIADGDVDGNDVAESDDSYDEYTHTNDDDDDDFDDDEILTVGCDNSVKN